ncbi:MAG: LPS-assembly protein LptD [Candidatus Margulisbacteria bacterium]|nr:LPS-assembly protein LptD [Candidatus Margulisiibacteriota bacterium]
MPTLILAQRVKLSADNLFFDEENRIMVASKNVILKVGNTHISADTLKLDVDKEIAWGTGNIHIQKEEEHLSAASFHYHMNHNTIQINDLSLTTSALGSTGNMYITASKMVDWGDYKIGNKALITTCEFDPPHYYLSASKFKYVKDKRVSGTNVFIYAPIYFIPFGFWLPYYSFAIGSRQVILLVPLLGNNTSEGTFVKNTVDYYFGEDKKGQVYVDFLSEKGTGYGWRHHYQINPNIQGHGYIYQLNDQSTQRENLILELENTVQLSDYLSFHHIYNTTDMYQLFGGQRQTTSQQYDFNWDEYGDVRDFRIKKDENAIQRNQNLNIQYDHRIHNRHPLNIKFDQQDKFSNQQRQQNGSIENELTLPGEIEFKSDITYRSQDTPSLPDTDEQLTSTFRFHKNLKGAFQEINIKFDYFFDLDDESVTTDLHTFLQKSPEIELNLTPVSLAGFTFRESILLGQYNESYLQSSSLRNFTTNRYMFRQKINRDISLPFNTTFDTNWTYDQSFYETGDQFYLFKQGYSTRSSWFGFWNTDISYLNQNGDGNSPFFFDGRSVQTETIKEKITFYLVSPETYRWSHETGWDWTQQKRMDYQTELNIQPSSKYRFNLRSGVRFNDDVSTKKEEFLNLIANIGIRPSNRFSVTLEGAYDLNIGKLQNMYNQLKWRVGDSWESRWDIESTFVYDVNIDGIRLDKLELIKDLHRRKLTLTYNFRREEYTFLYTLNAFPKDQFGLSTNENESIKLKGLFDDESQERL